MKPTSPKAATPLYWTKRIDNSRLVRQRQPGYRLEWAALGAAACVCLSVALFCAGLHFQYLETGYELEELRAEQERLLEWNRSLRLEQASLLDPMRVEALARAELGLAAPAADRLILLGPAGSPEALLPVVAHSQKPERVSLTD